MVPLGGDMSSGVQRRERQRHQEQDARRRRRRDAGRAFRRALVTAERRDENNPHVIGYPSVDHEEDHKLHTKDKESLTKSIIHSINRKVL